MVHPFGFFCSCHVAIRCAKAVSYWAPRIFHQFLNVHLTMCLQLDQKLYGHTAVLFVCDNFVFCCLGFNSLATRLECFQIWLLDWIKETFLCVKPLLDKLFFACNPIDSAAIMSFSTAAGAGAPEEMQCNFPLSGTSQWLRKFCIAGMAFPTCFSLFCTSACLRSLCWHPPHDSDCMSALEYVTSTYWAFSCAVFTHLW